MNIFEYRDKIITDYKSFTTRFTKILKLLTFADLPKIGIPVTVSYWSVN